MIVMSFTIEMLMHRFGSSIVFVRIKQTNMDVRKFYPVESVYINVRQTRQLTNKHHSIETEIISIIWFHKTRYFAPTHHEPSSRHSRRTRLRSTDQPQTIENSDRNRFQFRNHGKSGRIKVSEITGIPHDSSKPGRHTHNLRRARYSPPRRSNPEEKHRREWVGNGDVLTA